MFWRLEFVVILAELRHCLVFSGIFARGLGAIFNGLQPREFMMSGKLFLGLGLHTSLGFMVQGLGFDRSENACGFKDQGSMLTRSENGASPQK